MHGELLHPSSAAERVPAEEAEATIAAGDGAFATEDAAAAAAGGGSPQEPDLDWRATVTSAFRATLAATMRASQDSGSGGSAAGAACPAASGSDGGPDWPPLAAPRPGGGGCGDPRAERFQQWLRLLLFRLLEALPGAEGVEDSVWASALSCIAHFVTYHGGAASVPTCPGCRACCHPCGRSLSLGGC